MISLLIINLLIPITGFAEDELTQRKAFFKTLEQPKTITGLDWILLRWEVKLNDEALKKILLKAFEEEEDCLFGEIRFDENKKAFRVPILCSQKILSLSKNQRFEVIKKWGLKYIRLFNGIMSSEIKRRAFEKYFIFDANSTMLDEKGNIQDLFYIGAYEFWENEICGLTSRQHGLKRLLSIIMLC